MNEEGNVGEILILHLVNGMTIVAKIMANEDGDQDGYLLYKPMELVGGQRPDGTTGFGMAPYLSMGGLLPALEQYFMHFSMINLPRVCSKQIQDAYVQLTSGIQLVQTLPKNPPGNVSQLIRP